MFHSKTLKKKNFNDDCDPSLEISRGTPQIQSKTEKPTVKKD